MCTTISTKCAHTMKGFLALVMLLAYQLLCFLAFVSMSIGFAALFKRIFEFLVISPLPLFLEAFTSIFLISFSAEFHIICQQECIGNLLQKYYRKFPKILPGGSVVVYSFVFLIAYIGLYCGFEHSHVIPPQKTEYAPLESYDGGLHTAYFLISMGYIMYCLMSLIRLDTIEQMKRIHDSANCVHYIVIVSFMGLHLVMNTLYSIPLIIVAFSLRMYNYSALTTFFELTLVGLLSGVVFAVLETRKPWPTIRALRPFYLYENNSRAKATLAQVLVLFILFFFYRPNTYGRVPLDSFTAANDDVLFYCFAVAFNILHFTKVLTYIILQKNHPHVQQLDQEAMAALNAVVEELILNQPERRISTGRANDMTTENGQSSNNAGSNGLGEKPQKVDANNNNNVLDSKEHPVSASETKTKSDSFGRHMTSIPITLETLEEEDDPVSPVECKTDVHYVCEIEIDDDKSPTPIIKSESEICDKNEKDNPSSELQVTTEESQELQIVSEESTNNSKRVKLFLTHISEEDIKGPNTECISCRQASGTDMNCNSNHGATCADANNALAK